MVPDPFRAKRRILDDLLVDHRIDSRTIDVELGSDKIRISGSVSSESAFQAVEQEIRSLPYSNDVENRVTVEEDISPQTDQSVRDNTAAVLRRRMGSLADGIYSGVEDGILTLGGTVRSITHRYRAAGLAKTLPGVRGIVNKIISVPSGSSLDRQIGERIIKALEGIPGYDFSTVDVEVHSGSVVLGGVLPQSVSCGQLLERIRCLTGVQDINVDILNGRGSW